MFIGCNTYPGSLFRSETWLKKLLPNILTEDKAGCYCHPGLFFTVKKTCENSGTPEPDTSPVVPHFPHPMNLRGHNSEKCGIGPELINDFRWERMRSNIATLRRPKAGWDMVWDAAGTGSRGIFHHPPLEVPEIKKNSTEQFF